MPPNIVLCYPVEDRHLRQFETAFPQARIINAGQEGIAASILEADILSAMPRCPCPGRGW